MADSVFTADSRAETINATAADLAQDFIATDDVDFLNACRKIYQSREQLADTIVRQGSVTGTQTDTTRGHGVAAPNGCNAMMSELKNKIGNLVLQDVALMKQLLALNESIAEIKSQQVIWRKSSMDLWDDSLSEEEEESEQEESYALIPVGRPQHDAVATPSLETSAKDPVKPPVPPKPKSLPLVTRPTPKVRVLSASRNSSPEKFAVSPEAPIAASSPLMSPILVARSGSAASNRSRESDCDSGHASETPSSGSHSANNSLDRGRQRGYHAPAPVGQGATRSKSYSHGLDAVPPTCDLVRGRPQRLYSVSDVYRHSEQQSVDSSYGSHPELDRHEIFV